MAAEVGGLLVNLGLDVAQIKQDVGKAQKEMSGFQKNVNRQMGKAQRGVQKLTSGFKGLAAVVGGAAIVRGINQQAQALEEVNRQAESLGDTRQTIQELVFTFRQFGLQQNDVSDALGTLSDRAQDAKDGMKSFQEDFQLVNIEVADLRNKRPGELFDLFARKISDVEDPTRRTAAAVRIFGDDLGRRLLPLLQKGESGLSDYADQAREAGAVVSDELVKNGAEAAKTFRELQETIGAKFTQAVANNAEELRSLASAMVDVANFTATATSELVKFTEWLGESLAATVNGIAADDLVRLGQRIDEINNKLENARGVRGKSRISEQRREELEAEKAKLEKLVELERQRRQRSASGSESADPISSGVSGGGASGGTTGSSGSDLKQSISDIRDQVNPGREELREFRQQIDLLNKASEQGIDVSGLAVELNRKLSDDATNVRTLKGEMDNLKDSFNGVSDKSKETTEEISQFAIQASRNMQDAFADFLFDPFDEGLKGMVQQFAQAVQRMSAEAAAQNILGEFGGQGGGNGILGALQTGASSFFGGSGVVTNSAGNAPTTGNFLSFDGGGFTGNGPRSGGLDGRGGFPAMLHPRETVIDNARGGTNVTVNINNEGGEQIEATGQRTRRGPDGDTIVDLTVRGSIERLDAEGQLDGVFRRHGAPRQGQF